MLAPLVVTLTPAAWVMDCPVMLIPLPVVAVLAKLALSATAPPLMFTGPLTVTA